MIPYNKRVTRLLEAKGIVDSQKLKDAAAAADERGAMVSTVLLEMKLVDDRVLLGAIAEHTRSSRSTCASCSRTPAVLDLPAGDGVRAPHLSGPRGSATLTLAVIKTLRHPQARQPRYGMRDPHPLTLEGT
jgi:hypothetical protein